MQRKLKTIIIDDELPAREIIKIYLNDFTNFEIVAECSNGFEGLKAIADNKPDIIFLDIQMPKITGFEMLELIENPPKIIFTTAYDEYAIKAFEVNAVDYLLKQFSQERFKTAVEKVLVPLKEQRKQEVVNKKLIEHRDSSTQRIDHIVIKTGNNIKIIPIDKIIRLEAAGDYVMVYTIDGKF